jgi:hypothetical protein
MVRQEDKVRPEVSARLLRFSIDARVGKRHEQATRDDCRFCDPNRDSIRTTTRVTGHDGAVVSNRWYSGADSRSKKQLPEAHQAVVDRMQFPGCER